MQSPQTNDTTDRTTSIPAPRPPSRDAAEAALVEHYPSLVRLAHLILPPDLGRHRRVLAAHALVQRSLGRAGGLPRGGTGGRGAGAPGEARRVPRSRTGGEPGGSAHDWLRARVVHDALRPPLRVSFGAALPKVLGLRLFPRAGGTDELALDRALAAAAPATRAALALTALEDLAPPAVVALLRGAGVAEAGRAAAEAERLRAACGPDVAELLRRPEFDPCTVHLRPTDLLRRGRRVRLAALAGAVVLLAGTAVGVLDGPPATPPRTAASAVSGEVATGLPVRVPADRWADTSRVDFTAWPARGDRADDRALIRRALTEWTGGGPLAAGSEAPSLLYAGTVDGAAVVLLHTGRTLVRYTEPGPGPGNGRPALVRTRADDGDVTTAAAVVLARTGNRTRYLLAPWVAEAGTRDLGAPGSPLRPLRMAADGATEPLADAEPTAAAPGSCARVTALQLRSSTRIVEDHAFLLADLGGLVPAHLTWTPLPVPGEPARRPREATGPLGLAAWARSACSLARLRDGGVRSVNRWEYAAQELPEKAGRAVWVCARADTWEGRGTADITLEVPGRTLPVTTVHRTAACGRFGQDVLAGAYWSAPGGTRYVLAAGSRRVVGVTATGGVSAGVPGRLLAVRADGAAPLRLAGRLPEGASLPGWTDRSVEGGG
ncbi:hypothetical protein [Streptomyces showdoensis]|uniref:DNA-directed RNA polymerase specialized sigma24 family protein n=1 Tax=Streptomyces showdoensis TaxID=68268 RepID=A0A2P2GQI0_STREW|nr:hypothetical protein [Streptomyces showdoensis]KKZ73753.1 hypothetical protein VO63_11665 [Streptomyces showdoensis]